MCHESMIMLHLASKVLHNRRGVEAYGDVLVPVWELRDELCGCKQLL